MRQRGREKHSVRSIASLWSDVIMCSSPGCSPWPAHVWEMARDINITRYRTWLGKKLDKVKMRRASGTGKSHTHSSRRRTVGRSYSPLLDDTPNARHVPDGKKPRGIIEMRLNQS